MSASGRRNTDVLQHCCISATRVVGVHDDLPFRCHDVGIAYGADYGGAPTPGRTEHT